jgi:ATP-dependent DNA helicase DinG
MAVRSQDILGSEGPIARVLGGAFEARPEQAEMAAAVARAMEARSHLLVEAGTGVGKSFAYLVPAVLRCLAGEVVVVATNTIALQEQLVNKDIPLVRKALEEAGVIPLAREGDHGGEDHPRGDSSETESGGSARRVPFFKPVLVKGRGNYVSIRRLQLASERQSKLFGDPAALRTLHVIEDWAKETLDGTLSTLPPLDRPGVWDKVQSDSGNCMGRKCPQYRRCFYQQARREMETANLLVCNHALFFSDLALRAKDVGFLPKYDHVILDEAHGVEDSAADHFGISLSEGRVMHLLTSLYQTRSARGYLPQLQVEDPGLIDRAVRLVLACENASREFFESLIRLRPGRGDGDSGKQVSASGRIREAGAIANSLTPAARELSLCLKAIREKIKNEQDKYELNAYSMRAAAVAEEAEALVNQSAPGYAYWVESGAEDAETLRGRVRRVTLACSPVEVAPVLKEKLFDEKVSVVMTSATLALSSSAARQEEGLDGERRLVPGEDSFGHIKSRLGCEAADTLLLGSPFEHSAQMELHIERTMPRPEGKGVPGGRAMVRALDELDQRPPEEQVDLRRSSSSLRHSVKPSLSYNDHLAARILEHVEATQGGAFVLFTSFATLNAMAERLGRTLEARGMPLFVHGRDGPRMQLLERFREDERSVLFGAASFWQGVDVRGRGLRNVIITRLPFDPPDRPLTEARLEKVAERGGDGFFEESLPRAVIKFKQGFGRLIRSKTDTGRVVVLDPRIVTTGYGKRFLEALPEGVRVVEG